MLSLRSRKGSSRFAWSSTGEEVTQGINGSGLIAIVTGSNSGIGKETTRVLALRGVHVIMAVRNVNGGREVKEEIVSQIPNAKIDVMELDLASFSSIRKFASEYISSGLHLNILINNAGVTGNPFMLSVDNIELQFATNHLGHFLLTNLLLDTMKKTSRESGTEGRIVNVSSGVHKLAILFGGIDFNKINDSSTYKHFNAYVQSKLANVLHANELARRLKEDGSCITVNSLHPGTIWTSFFRHQNFFTKGIIKVFFMFVLKSVPQGAATTCYVALHPQVKGLSGEYFVDNNISKASSMGRDMDLAKKLWDFSLNLTT